MATGFNFRLSIVFLAFGGSVSVMFSKYCLDEGCKQVLFQTKATSLLKADHVGTLSHNAGDLIDIYSIGSSDVPYFWEGDISGSTPPAPKKVYISKIDLMSFLKFFEDYNGKNLVQVTYDDSTIIDNKSIPADKVYADVVKDVRKYVAHFAQYLPAPKTVSPLASIVKHEHHHHHHDHHHHHSGEHSHDHYEPTTFAPNLPSNESLEVAAKLPSVTTADGNEPLKEIEKLKVAEPVNDGKYAKIEQTVPDVVNPAESHMEQVTHATISSKSNVQSSEPSENVGVKSIKNEIELQREAEGLGIQISSKTMPIVSDVNIAAREPSQEIVLTSDNSRRQSNELLKTVEQSVTVTTNGMELPRKVEELKDETKIDLAVPVPKTIVVNPEVALATDNTSKSNLLANEPQRNIAQNPNFATDKSESVEMKVEKPIKEDYPKVAHVVPQVVIPTNNRGEQMTELAKENVQSDKASKNIDSNFESTADGADLLQKVEEPVAEIPVRVEEKARNTLTVPQIVTPPTERVSEAPKIMAETPMPELPQKILEAKAQVPLDVKETPHVIRTTPVQAKNQQGGGVDLNQAGSRADSRGSSHVQSRDHMNTPNQHQGQIHGHDNSYAQNHEHSHVHGVAQVEDHGNVHLQDHGPQNHGVSHSQDASHSHAQNSDRSSVHHRDHGHDHNHAHQHEHSHDTSGHHHHHHGPTFNDKIVDAAKTTKTWAFWIKENLKPFVAGLKLALRPVHRLVPMEFRDFIGVRELIFTFLLASSFIYISVQWTIRTFGGEDRKNLIALCKFAELYDKFKVLEVENEKLKKSNINSEQFDAEIKKEKSVCEIKSRECSRLMDDLTRLNAENKQLKDEIINLKSQVTKLSDKSSFERELQQLKATNSSLEIDLSEFKASFERERQIKERIEKENEKVLQEVARLKEEKSKTEEKLKTKSEEIVALKEKDEELRRKCSELEVQCKELEGLKLVLSRKRTAKQEIKSKPQTKTSSDENESNGKDWDWADDVSVAESDAAAAANRNKVVDDKDDLAGLLSDDQLADLVRLGAELKEKMDEIDRLKILIKDLMNEKQELDKSCANLKMENETLTSSLRDANEKSLTLESKIKALKDIYEDQMKDLTKQLTKQQLEKEKQSNAMSSVEDDMNRIRDENATLRKIDAELQAEIKELNNLYKKTRLELDRCIHEKWAESRRYEREKTAIQSENALLRARLVSNAPPMPRSDDEKNQPLSSPETGRQPTAGALNPGDVSNNSSEAELAGITRASPVFPLKTPQLPTMPSYPPPPPMGMMPYGPPPPLSGYMSAGGGSSSFYGPFDDYRRASPAQSPRDFHYSSRHDIRGGQPRRNKSKARSNPSRSPSPTYGSSGPRRETSDYGLGGNASKNRRARSRGGASNRDRREESQSPPPPPTSSRRRHDARRCLDDEEDDYQMSSSHQQYNSRHSASLYK